MLRARIMFRRSDHLLRTSLFTVIGSAPGRYRTIQTARFSNGPHDIGVLLCRSVRYVSKLRRIILYTDV